MNAGLQAESPGRAELVFALGVGLLLVSGLLPWIAASEAIPVADPSEEAEGLASFDAEHTSAEILGIDRVDWVVLAGVGLVATGLVVTEPWSQIVLAFAAASGVAAVGLGAVYLVDPAWMYSDWIKPDVAAVASAGPGVYLAIGGGILQLGGSYLAYSESESTTGAQQLDAASPTRPGANQAARGGQPQEPPRGGRREPRRQQRPPGQQPPQGAGPNQRQPSGGQPRHRGGQRQSSGQPPANGQPPTEQRPPERQPGQDHHEGGRQPQGTKPNHQQSTETPPDTTGQPRGSPPEGSPPENDPERSPTERSPEQPPSGRQPDSDQQPANREQTGDEPTEQPEPTDQTADDTRQGTGSGQRRNPQDSPEETNEDGGASEDADQREK